MELESALQELVEADQEARRVHGELEVYWADLAERLETMASALARNIRGALRGGDIADARATLELVRVRITAAAQPSRELPSMPGRDPDFGRHGAGVIAELDEILMAYDDVVRLRRWARACHQLWAPDVEVPFGGGAELADMQAAADLRPDLVQSTVRTYRFMRPAKIGFIVVSVGLAIGAIGYQLSQSGG